MADPFISEIRYLGNRNVDFIEVAVDAGTDVSDLVVTVYQSNGTVRSSNALAGLTSTTVAGKDIYVVQVGSPSTFNGVAASNGVALSDSSQVYSFVSFTNTPAAVTATEGPASGLTSTEIGQAGSGSSLESTDDGASYQVQSSPTPGIVPCLAKGTRVRTREGWLPVEHLQAGDLLLTWDGSFKPLVDVLRKHITARDFRRNPKLRPVRITAGSLGHGLPRRDLLVSRQHRMLVSSRIVKRMFDASDALVAAIRLTEFNGVFVDETVEQIEYYHLLFDAHEVIFAEGAATESLLLDPSVPDALSGETRAEILSLVPQHRQPNQVTPRQHLIPTMKRQSKLVSRHVDNACHLTRPRIAKLSRGMT